jgi:hypothetical protein
MSDIKYVYLTRDEAIKHVKRSYKKGITHFVSGSPFLYTKTPDECSEGENPRGFDGYVHIEVSQKVAIKYINDSIRQTLFEKGVRIKIGTSDNCIFVG